jgi:hypothetical protein
MEIESVWAWAILLCTDEIEAENWRSFPAAANNPTRARLAPDFRFVLAPPPN